MSTEPDRVYRRGRIGLIFPAIRRPVISAASSQDLIDINAR